MNSLPRVLVVALLSLFASIAQARDLKHDLHFSLDAGLVGWSKMKIERPFRGEAENKVTEVGFPTALGAHVGFMPFDVLETGVRFSCKYTKNDRDGDTISSSVNEVYAYARYVMPGDSWRPFVGPIIGAGFFRDSNPSENGGPSYSSHGTDFSVGGELGLYGFVFDGLSLDPVFSFTYNRGSADVGAALPDLIGANVNADYHGFQLALGLSLSGWVSL
ncbi:MAG TPA: outer membrane beta-barrel protein [Polyangiales bacterium]